MEIRNSTKKTLAIYIGDKNQEEPDLVKILLAGEICNIPDNVPGIISIQDNIEH